jgi:protein-S-isoprenylcysteine O-methyltransferase Ste14
MGMRVPWDRSGVRTYLIAIGLIAGHTTPKWVAIGTPLLLAGMAMQLWAKGCLHQEKEVTSGGPYRFVRHPFYLANFILDISIVVMSGWWVLAVVAPVWWLIVYVRVMRREEGVMAGLFGDAYADYRGRVPMLFPYRWPLPKSGAGGGGFSWHNPNLRRVELPRALRSLSYPLMFLAAYRIRIHIHDLRALGSMWDMLLVGAFLALRIAVWALKRRRAEKTGDQLHGAAVPGTEPPEALLSGSQPSRP